MGAPGRKNDIFKKRILPKDFSFLPDTRLGRLPNKTLLSEGTVAILSVLLFLFFLTVDDVNRPETEESCGRERERERADIPLVSLHFPDA